MYGEGVDECIEQAASLFKVLSSPVRLRIIVRLHESPMAVQELAEAVGVSQTLLSQHLRVMRMAGLVRADLDGRHRTYRITDEHVSHIVLDDISHSKEEH